MEELREIKQKLKGKYDLEVEIKESKLCCSNFTGYINCDEKHIKIEELCIAICDWIGYVYDFDCDYSLLDEGYEFAIEIF